MMGAVAFVIWYATRDDPPSFFNNLFGSKGELDSVGSSSSGKIEL